MILAGTLSELATVLLGLALTLLVYSYVVRDNPLYRLAVHLLVGVAAGYAVVIVVREVIEPVLSAVATEPLSQGGMMWLLPLLLAVLLLFKLSPLLASVGNGAMAVLMAVGAAVGLTGAIVGTLIPQIVATPGGLMGLVVAILTAMALAYFIFYAGPTSRGGLVAAGRRHLRFGGRLVITVALAGVFAALMNTGLVLLAERVGYFLGAFNRIFGG